MEYVATALFQFLLSLVKADIHLDGQFAKKKKKKKKITSCKNHSDIYSHWSMVTHRLRNERTGFVFWTHRFLRKMADIRPLSQVRNIFYVCFIAIR